MMSFASMPMVIIGRLFMVSPRVGIMQGMGTPDAGPFLASDGVPVWIRAHAEYRLVANSVTRHE
jgi:hypothetical protein